MLSFRSRRLPPRGAGDPGTGCAWVWGTARVQLRKGPDLCLPEQGRSKSVPSECPSPLRAHGPRSQAAAGAGAELGRVLVGTAQEERGGLGASLYAGGAGAGAAARVPPRWGDARGIQPWGAARPPSTHLAVFHSQTLSAAALLFQIYCVFACSDLFVYSPPSPANFSAWIAFIHESPPFLSLTRARSNCRREEARTLFPLFKVTRLVPGPGASSALLPTLRVSCPCSLPPRPPPGCRGRWEGSTCGPARAAACSWRCCCCSPRDRLSPSKPRSLQGLGLFPAGDGVGGVWRGGSCAGSLGLGEEAGAFAGSRLVDTWLV